MSGKYQLYETGEFLWNSYDDEFSDSYLYDIYHLEIKDQTRSLDRIDSNYWVFDDKKSPFLELESIYNIRQVYWCRYYE